MKDVYRQAMEWFLVSPCDPVDFLAPPKEGKLINIWLDNAQIAQIKQLAKTDCTYDNRIIYTGLVRFLQHRTNPHQ